MLEDSHRVHVEYADAVAIVELDNPPLNPLSYQTYRELLDVLEELSSRGDIRVVVCSASPRCRSFSAGADVVGFGELLEKDRSLEYFELAHMVVSAVRDLRQITIAGLDGDALGGGAELALAFDLRIGGSAGRFGFPELTIGQFPGPDGTTQLPEGAGMFLARSLVLGAELISMERARELGIIDYVVPGGIAREVAKAWATKLANYPAQAVLAAKSSLEACRQRALFEEAAKWSAVLSDWAFRGADSLEGQLSFVEKRAPRFVHEVPPLPEVNR